MTQLHEHNYSMRFFDPLIDTPGQIQNAGFQRDFSFNTLTTSWDPLPTLDLNNTDSDLIYTVQLLKITCGQSTLIDQTTVARSNATVENLDMMQIYKATVAARNNVREARNGKRVIIEGVIIDDFMCPYAIATLGQKLDFLHAFCLTFTESTISCAHMSL